MIRLFARRNKLEPTAVCSRLQFVIRKLEIINDIVLHIMFEAKFLSTLERVPYIRQGIWGVEGFEPCPTILASTGLFDGEYDCPKRLFGSPTSLNNNGQFFLPFTGE